MLRKAKGLSRCRPLFTKKKSLSFGVILEILTYTVQFERFSLGLTGSYSRRVILISQETFIVLAK